MIGVYPIDIRNINHPEDGEDCVYEAKFSKASSVGDNGKDAGYNIPGGCCISFSKFLGDKKLWLTNF